MLRKWIGRSRQRISLILLPGIGMSTTIAVLAMVIRGTPIPYRAIVVAIALGGAELVVCLAVLVIVPCFRRGSAKPQVRLTE
jgi:hypothetical protein